MRGLHAGNADGLVWLYAADGTEEPMYEAGESVQG